MKTTVFLNNKTQAVRIPKALQLPPGTKEVEIVKEGDALIIRPKPKFASWKDYFARRTRMPDDFMVEREDLPPQTREFPWD